MNYIEAAKKACEQPTLSDALSWIAVWESERAIKQALQNEKTGMGNPDGSKWDTCFRVCFEEVLKQWGQPVYQETEEVYFLLKKANALLSDMALCDSAPKERGISESTERALYFAKQMGWAPKSKDLEEVSLRMPKKVWNLLKWNLEQDRMNDMQNNGTEIDEAMKQIKEVVFVDKKRESDDSK